MFQQIDITIIWQFPVASRIYIVNMKALKKPTLRAFLVSFLYYMFIIKMLLFLTWSKVILK